MCNLRRQSTMLPQNRTQNTNVNAKLLYKLFSRSNMLSPGAEELSQLYYFLESQTGAWWCCLTWFPEASSHAPAAWEYEETIQPGLDGSSLGVWDCQIWFQQQDIRQDIEGYGS